MTRSSSIPEGPASSRPGRARRRLVLVAGAIVVAFPILALASPLDIPNEFAAGDMISADAFNENFEMVAASVNDNDARIAALEAAVASIAGAPAGGVVFFNLATCPEGWIELQAMRGRVPLGLPAGGTFGDVVGDELDPQGTVTITQVPTHTHTSGGLTATASTNTHGHSLSGGGTHNHSIVAGGGSHDHEIRVDVSSGFASAAVGGVLDQAASGSDSFGPIQSGGTHSHSITAGEGTHTHSVGSTDHSHTITMSGSTGNNAGGVASVDVTMPYMQLLACQKT
jgi:hypothetical protein